MSILRLVFVPVMAIALLTGAAGFGVAPRPVTRELIVCGREKVFILDLNARDATGVPKTIWTWKAAGRTDLPAEYHPLFRSTDECKPVDGGRRILITSSTGGVALVDRETSAVVFYGRAANAHSAELLPSGRVAVASSGDPRGKKGDALILFDVAQSGRELWRTELTAGHGVVWDEQRRVVWALSSQELRSYALTDWDSATPTLGRMTTIELPEGGGHDLYPVPGTSFLSLTTSAHCWHFDRDRNSIRPHPHLADQPGIKSIDLHPITGQLAFTQGEQPNWWTTRIQFLHPGENCSVPGEQFYKVRWNVSPPE